MVGIFDCLITSLYILVTLWQKSGWNPPKNKAPTDFVGVLIISGGVEGIVWFPFAPRWRNGPLSLRKIQTSPDGSFSSTDAPNQWFSSQPAHTIKKPTIRSVFFWWEWLDSNQLRLKPTDLQSAPALQLRRTPELIRHNFYGMPHKALAKCGAGRGNRTLISSLEGLHTSLCTMPATKLKPTDYITNEIKIKNKI